MSDFKEIRSTQFTLKDSGLVEVRTTTHIVKDDKPVGKPSHHRVVLNPRSDLDAVSVAPGETGALPDEVKAAVQAWWTPERVSKFEAAIARLAQIEDGPSGS